MNSKNNNVPFHHHQRASSWQGQGQGEAQSSASLASAGLTMAPQHRSRSSASPILMQQSPQQQQSSQQPHQQQQQQHSHDTSSNLTAAQTKCDSVVWEGIVKATEVVVRSRCILSSLEEDANQTGVERGDPGITSSRTATTASASSTSRGSRFHLDVNHVPSIRKALVPWKKSLKVPLQLDIFYHFHSHEKQRDERILLERWCFEYQYLEDPSSSTTNRNSTTTSHSTMSDLRQVVKNLVVLLRCLLSYTRLLPAYSIHCFLSQETETMSSSAPHEVHEQHAQPSFSSSSSKSTNTTFIGYAFHGAAINPTTGKYDTNDPYLIRNNFKQHEFRTLPTPFGKLVVTIWYHPLSTQIASTQLQRLKQQQQKRHSIVVGTTPTSAALPIPISTTTNRKGEPLQQQQQPSSSFHPSNNSPSFGGSTTPRNVSEFLIPDYHSPKPESFLSKRMQREEQQQHHPISSSTTTRNSNEHKGGHDEASTVAPGNTATAPMKPSLSGLSLAMLHQDEQQQQQQQQTQDSSNRGMIMMHQQGVDSSVRRNSGTSTPLLSSSPSSFVTTRQLSNSPGPFAMLSEAVGTGIGSARSSNSHRAVVRPSSFTNRSGGNFIGSSNTNRSGSTINKGVRPPSPPFGNHTQHNLNQELPSSSDRSFSTRMKQNSSGGGGSDRNLLLGGGHQGATGDALLLEPHNSFEKLHNSPFLSLSGALPSSSSHPPYDTTTTNKDASLMVTSNHAAATTGSTTNLMMSPMIGLLPRSQTSLLPLGPPHHHFGGGGASSAVMGATVAPQSSSLLGLSSAGGAAGGSTTLHAATASASAFHSHISSLSFASGGPIDGGLESSTVSSWKQQNNNSFLHPAAATSSSVAVWEEMPFATDEGERMMMHNFGSREGQTQQEEDGNNSANKKKVVFGSSSAVVSTPAILSFSKQCTLASHLSLLEKDGANNIDGDAPGSNHRMTFLSSSSSLSPQEESQQQQAEQLASFKQFAATLKLN